MSSSADIPLIEAIQQGDQKALAALYDAYGGALYGTIIRIVRKDDLAQEVLQDTFVKIWRNAAAYDLAKGKPFTWMLNIARNTSIDMVRSAGVRHGAAIRSMDDHVHYLGHDEVREGVEHADVRGVLDKLKPEHRELIDLAYYQGFSQQEIADKVGLPLGTVKSRTRSALSELRVQLKDHR